MLHNRARSPSAPRGLGKRRFRRKRPTGPGCLDFMRIMNYSNARFEDAFVRINSEDRLVRKTFADHLHAVYGGEILHAIP